MKIPAIRSHIGDWTYYISYLTFKQVAEMVEKVGPQITESRVLGDAIQRSITENYKSISTYIQTQNERFFNSLVLAVYNEAPNWIAVEMQFDEENEFHNLGFLEYSGNELIFPIDGQHRVEGIKDAITENIELESESIPIILVAHYNNPEGMQRSRRLFTTLNRYAKAVSLRDIIALDEDDSIAIITRRIIENNTLFQGAKVVDIKNKAIPTTNTSAITSIIALYQCNIELLKGYYFEKENKILTAKARSEYLRFRKTDEEISQLQVYISNYWQSLIDNNEDISNYIENFEENGVSDFRNNENGGNLLFRPVGIVPFVSATVEIKRRSDEELSYDEIISRLCDFTFIISESPWNDVMWNTISNRMLMSGQTLTKSLFIFLYDIELLSDSELQKLKNDYASKKGNEDIDEEFANLRVLIN